MKHFSPQAAVPGGENPGRALHPAARKTQKKPVFVQKKNKNRYKYIHIFN